MGTSMSTTLILPYSGHENVSKIYYTFCFGYVASLIQRFSYKNVQHSDYAHEYLVLCSTLVCAMQYGAFKMIDSAQMTNEMKDIAVNSVFLTGVSGLMALGTFVKIDVE